MLNSGCKLHVLALLEDVLKESCQQRSLGQIFKENLESIRLKYSSKENKQKLASIKGIGLIS